jgi:hypothetical protein
MNDLAENIFANGRNTQVAWILAVICLRVRADGNWHTLHLTRFRLRNGEPELNHLAQKQQERKHEQDRPDSEHTA